MLNGRSPAIVADPIPVVVLTTFDLDEFLRQAIGNGASGFLLKDAGPALIVEAVRAAASGDALVSPSITVRILAHFAAHAADDAPSEHEATLTGREEDIVRAPPAAPRTPRSASSSTSR